MNETEQRRADVLTRLVGKSITTLRAAQLLGVTERQARRLKAAFQHSTLASIPHGNKGRKPAHAIPQDTADQIWELAGPQGLYHDFNVCHLKEQLEQEHQIVIGRSTLQRILQERRRPASGLPAPRPKPVTSRSRRLRSAAAGTMVQIDGSPHDWLEGRAPRMCLMGAIDDATSTLLYLQFRPTETALGYLHLLRHIGIHYGLPMSYYHDKHTILRSPKKATPEDDLAGREPMSHIQQVMHALGIESIAAHSPQAKGRIERLWQTLQDRLVKEMRLADIGTIADANRFLETFLPRHNARFACEAMDLDDAWVSLEAECDWNYHFSLEDRRIVKADHTVCFEGAILQITAASRPGNLAGKSISVRTNAEGTLFLYDGKRRLAYRIITAKAPKAPAARKAAPLPAEPETLDKRRTPNEKQRAFLHAKP